MVGRAIALSLLCALAGCGTSGSRPPPLLQEQQCAEGPGCIGSGGKDAAPNGDAAPPQACPFVNVGELRGGPARGKVVELDDPTLALHDAPFRRPYYATPLSGGTVSVEIERDNCELATGLANADGTFAVEGTAVGEVSIRLVPIDRPDLITTIHHYKGDDPRLEYAILTRASLDGIFAMLDPGATPDPTSGQIIVTFLYNFNAAPIPGATFSTGLSGEIVYDGDLKAGKLGLGAALNVPTKPYPGEASSVTIHALDRTRPTSYVSVAQDAVSIIHAYP
jgi:hypothetical protein